jgi:phospholipid/cholesterol/gamma-HCH transport system ATP-binding protein
MPPAIQIRGLVAAYGDVVVLDGIDLDVAQGEILFVMGQSGCGKSTFLRHLVGLMHPAGGSIQVAGLDMDEVAGRDYRTFCQSVGVLFQSGGLFNSMTVAENVAFPLREHTTQGEDEIAAVVAERLHDVGLDGAGGKMPGELSGGMKRRAGLARALALDPDILFLDEPTSGLDPIIAAGIDDLILELRERHGTTTVVVSHDITSGMQIADRIAIFHERRLLALGTPSEIRNSEEPYVRQFLARHT